MSLLENQTAEVKKEKFDEGGNQMRPIQEVERLLPLMNDTVRKSTTFAIDCA